MLVVLQFTTSIVLIVGTFIIYRQVEYILNTMIGFDKDQVVLFKGANRLGDDIKTLITELLRLPQVKSVSKSDYLPIEGTLRNNHPFWKEGKSKEESPVSRQLWRIDHDYIKTLGMKIVAGRDFSLKMASDSHAVVINEAMVQSLGLSDPVGKRISNFEEVWTVIGVVEDLVSTYTDHK